MPTNSGKPWNASQSLHSPAHNPRPAERFKSAESLAAEAYYKSRASELPLDTALMDSLRRDAKAMRIIGYALLAVTFAVFGVLLWPWLSA